MMSKSHSLVVARPRRKGQVAIFLFLALPVLAVAVGLVFNNGALRSARQQLNNLSDAAALAAGQALVDDRVLAERTGSDDLLALIDDVHKEAFEYVKLNSVALGPGDVELVLDKENQVDGDLLFGWLPHRKAKDIVVADLQKPVRAELAKTNTIQVKAVRSRKRGNPVGLFPMPWQLSTAGDVATRSTVFLDGHIHGFRPLPSVAIPMAPLGILMGSSSLTWNEQLKIKRDDKSFDRVAKTFVDGTDGIFEVEIKLASGPSHVAGSNACLLRLGADEPDTFDLAAQILNGISEADLSRADLAHWNKEIRLPLDGSGLIAPASLIGPTGDGADRLSEALATLAASGEGRIWPLFIVEADQIVLHDFVAARVVQVLERSNGQSLHFLLQPCRLASGTAITYTQEEALPASPPWNRYICKVRLTE